MDVWHLYLSAHNGKQPRNAFDLVNFSRQTQKNTLTFATAKQLYQNNTTPQTNINLHPCLNLKNSSSDSSSSPAILKSPKAAVKHIHTQKKVKKRKKSTRHIKTNTHKSRHNSTTNHSKHSSFQTTKFNIDEILKESEDNNNINYSIALDNIYKSDSTLHNQSSDSFDNNIINNRKNRRKKNQSSPVTLNIKRKSFTYNHNIKSPYENTAKSLKKMKFKKKHFSQLLRVDVHGKSSDSSDNSDLLTSQTMNFNQGKYNDSDSGDEKLKLMNFSKSNPNKNKRKLKFKHKRHRHKRHKLKLKKMKSADSGGDSDGGEKRTHKKSKKMKKNKLNLRPTKVRRALSADPTSIMNGRRRRKKKVKPPPSKHMKKHRDSVEIVDKRVQRHYSNLDVSIHERHKNKDKKRANSDYFETITQENNNSQNNKYRLDRIYNEKKKKKLNKRHNSESSTSIDEEMKYVKKKHNKYRVGDVVQVSLKIGDTKKLDLARIRYYGTTCLDRDNYMFGIECFKFQFNTHKICGKLVNDSSINGRKKLFQVKKVGYGTFIKAKGIKSSKCLWNLKMSKNALKLKYFDAEMLINASKYGSVKVVKHLFKLLINQNNPKSSRYRSRSGSNCSYKKSIDDSYMTTIQTSFGYAVLNNHTKIIKIILTHCGSNAMYTQKYHNRNKNKKKLKKNAKSKSDFMIHKSRKKSHKSHKSSCSSSPTCSNSNCSTSSDLSDDEFDDEYDDDFNDELHDGMSKFYTSDLFDLVCEQKNFKMLQLLIQYDSWPLLSPNSRGLYGIFCKKGYLKWIKYLLQISPYIVNMPLMSTDINSTMIYTCIANQRYEYAKFLLGNYQIQLIQPVSGIPILLLTIMSLNLKNITHQIEIIDILLKQNANINWIPHSTLAQQQHLFSANYFDEIDEYSDHKLLSYDNMLIGSMLSALIYKFVFCFKNITENNKKYAFDHLSDLLSLFMLYGIDFEHMEVQHIWLEYDHFSKRWNLNNFPYNLCKTKKEFIFIQKIFKKALRKYPTKLLNEISSIESLDFNEELINIFKLYIIPYSVYDALMFESLHYYAPYTPDVSSPESVDFMFAYQRSPIVE